MNEEVYEKASDAEAAEESDAGDTEEEAEDVETKELRRSGEAEAPNRAALRGRRPAPIAAADGEGRRAGSAARRESMRQAEAEMAGEGEVEAKAAMEVEEEGGSERAEQWLESFVTGCYYYWLTVSKVLHCYEAGQFSACRS